MKTKFTKGEFDADYDSWINDGDVKTIEIFSDDRKYWIAQFQNDGDIPMLEAIANVKLFLASKELFAACAEFVRKVECGEARSKKSYKQMKEAIEKAIK